MTDLTGSKVYTVNEICSDIKRYISKNERFENILVEGEVSNPSDAQHVHLYFSLRDKNTKAILPVAMFGWKAKLGSVPPVRAGDKVIVYGSINIYADRGQYQIIAEKIFPQGSGILNQKLEELKRKLGAEGLFDEEHKRPIPRYASRIGIVTSATGAAIGDIRKIAQKRNPYVQLILYPSMVQGAGAAQNIAAGIRELQRHAVDVIIIGRGGGPSEDFSAFNEEIVARAVYESKVPVISAVGHNRDESISDLTADKFAATPTEAADLAVFDVWDVMQTIDRYRESADRRIQDRLKRAEDRSENYRLKLEMKNPRRQIRDNRKRIEDAEARLKVRMERIFADKETGLRIKAGDLEARSPLKKLESGYAFLTKPDGQRISRAAGLNAGDRIHAYMWDGSFFAVIDEAGPEKAVREERSTTEEE